MKNILIEKIRGTNDEQVLQEASRLLEIELNVIEVPFLLNDEMNEAINEAQEHLQKGEFMTNNMANKEIEEWLEK